MKAEEVALKLMLIAARRSVEGPLGWACPDCEVLEEAARIVRGDPIRQPDPHPIGVLSSDT